jgi:hypothetical protein
MKNRKHGLFWMKMNMSDSPLKQKQAGVYINANDIDVTDASLDPTLSKVWTDETTGEIAVSVERVLFDSLLDVAARYLEPNGFSLNLENLLATIDSMRLGVFASVASKNGPDGRAVAKKLIPGLYMHLPRVKTVGPTLTRFYDEIGRYERELARLQDIEAKARKIAEVSAKDETGRAAIEALQSENQALRAELGRLSSRLNLAEQALKSSAAETDGDVMPNGIRSCVIRAVRPAEGTVLLKSGEQQFSCPLRRLDGVPSLNARGLAYYEGGVLKSVMIFDPAPAPFEFQLADVMAVEGRKIKVRYSDRREGLLTMAADQAVPGVGVRIIAKLATGFLVDILPVAVAGDSVIADMVFDEQTKRQLHEEFAEGLND